MPLNAWLAIGVVMVIIASPLIVLTLPLWGWWLLRQRRLKAERGLVWLLPVMADTASRYGEAMVRGDAPVGDAALVDEAPGGDGDWDRIGRNVDRFLAAAPHNPRRWRLPMLLLALEFAPLAVFRPPFSWMGVAARCRFVDRNLSRTTGLFGVFSLARQAVRLAYYSDPSVHRRLGFRPPRLPRRARRSGRGARRVVS